MELFFRQYATTYGTGPFHPAIQSDSGVWYWPNITKATEQEAYEHAALALKEAYNAANAISQCWNVYKV